MSQSNEYLLNNALAEDFQQMLRPYCLTQKMLCASKCSIKDNFVLPNSKTYRAFVMFVLCFITYAYFATSWAMSCTIGNECPLTSDIHSLLARFISSACIIVQTESAVKLLIIMQDVDRKLKTFGVQRLSYFVIRNWFSTVFILLLFVLGILVTALNTDRMPWLTYIIVFLNMIFDLDVLYATCIVEFLSSRLRCFSNLIFAYVDDPLYILVENNSINTFKDLFKIFKETVEAFALSSNLVQYPVLSYTISTFFTSLVTLQKVIEWTKNAKISEVFGNISVIYILTVAFNIKNFIVVVMFSVACERFYSRLDDIKRNCAVVLDLPLEESVFRKTTKNILRLCDVSSSKMRVCSLFTVDAALPLRLLGLMATYCIVLLQFAFL